MIFPITVESINGFRSRVAAGKDQRKGDQAYYRLVALMRKTQQSGAFGMRIIKQADQKQTTVMFFHRKNISPEIKAARMEINRILGLDPERQEISVVYGLIPKNDRENAFTAVKYEDHWFWIDKRDFGSKRTFAFLMILMSLTETGGKEGLPRVTIPAG